MSRSRRSTSTTPSTVLRRLNCPVCGSRLEKGETVRTAAYPGRDERLVHIFGCPRCFGPAAHIHRKCPVCRKRLEGENHLIGRLIATDGRVKVWGCSLCGGGRR